jgi:peptidoglycan-associated lipoprotein
MKRYLLIVTLVAFAFSSAFIVSSCAKKQVVTAEEEVKAAPKEEMAKAEPVKEEAAMAEAAKKSEAPEEAKVERLKELEEAKKEVAEGKVAEEKVTMEQLVVAEKAAEKEAEKEVEKEVEKEAVAPAFDEEGAWRERMAAQVEAEPIYFDFDRSFIRPEYRAVLAKKAEFLKENPGSHLRVEGNCDERGTNEYNLALGERRSNSAKNYLVSLGISPDRIETISYGEERPLSIGHNEDSWSQNRRDDFVLIAK